MYVGLFFWTFYSTDLSVYPGASPIETLFYIFYIDETNKMTGPTGCSGFVHRTTGCLDQSVPGWLPSSSPLPRPYSTTHMRKRWNHHCCCSVITVSMVLTQMGWLSYFTSMILNQTGSDSERDKSPRSPWQPEMVLQLNTHLHSGWFLLGMGYPFLTSLYFHGPTVYFKAVCGGCRLLCWPPRWVPTCCSCPVSACSCQKSSRNERARGEKSWPMAAIEITLEDGWSGLQRLMWC